MKYNWIIVLLSVLLFFVSGNLFAVHATYLDFETLADGITLPTDRSSGSTAYEALGVTFSGGGYTTQPRFRRYDYFDPAIAELPPASNEWFLLTDARVIGSLPPQAFDLNIFFNHGVSEASGDVFYGPTSSGIMVNAYDAYDLLLESISMPSGQATWIGGSFSFTSSSSIIHRIELVSINYSQTLGLDNLSFEPVPEPSTILLFGIGLLGITGPNRRKK